MTYIKAGRKTKDWNNAKRKLKIAFAEVGLTYCEVGLFLTSQYLEDPLEIDRVRSYRHQFALGFAHGKKRRWLGGDELLTFVALSCQDCHDYIEYRDDMSEIVQGTIDARRVQPKTYHD
jgi:hypothetical protein